MVDRVYWIWQVLHLDQAKTLAGTNMFLSDPPSPKTTVEDFIQMNYLNVEARPIRELIDTLRETPFCYIYG
jgi:tyrosinase